MQKEIAIKIENVHKKFRVFHDKSYSMKERLLFRSRNKYEDRWVLKGVDMDIHKGEAVGLVGENGCGKSTLLKMMTKIMYPDKGQIETFGRISSLIELGAGFHPDMSGRENIFTNAAILGLKHDEVERRLPEIIRFSELEEYIDNPVRTYSSGMYMRLAFSVAINVDADILLIDEILAVGDTNFQTKCFNKLREIKRGGATIVIVSHALGQIEQICDTSYWIENGKIKSSGDPREVNEDYMDYMNEKRRGREIKDLASRRIERQKERDEELLKQKTEEEEQKQSQKEEELRQKEEEELVNRKRWGTGDAKIEDVKIFGLDSKEKYTFNIGEKMNIIIKYKANISIEKPNIGFEIFRNDGQHCYGTNTSIDKFDVVALKEEGTVEIEVVNTLIEGEYFLDVAIYDIDGVQHDHFKEASEFTMNSNIKDVGIARLEHSWKIN